MTSAQRSRAELRRLRPRALLEHHAFAIVATLGRLTRDPLGTLLTITVIAIALALPLCLELGVRNLQAASADWRTSDEVTVFLTAEATEVTAEQVMQALATRPDVATIQRVSPEEGLALLEERGEFGDALTALEANPLPWALVVRPAEGLSVAAIEALAEAARALDDVAMAQFDMTWLIRFNAMLLAATRVGELVAVLLALGVLLVVGNTIRLDIRNRREEIEIIKMLGGTDGFVRRPFLYTGAWLGLVGGVAALLIVAATSLLLAGPVDRLAAAYGTERSLRGLGFAEIGGLLIAATLLGWIGARIAVGRQLRSIRPERS